MCTTSRQSGRRTRSSLKPDETQIFRHYPPKCSSFFMHPRAWTRFRFSVGMFHCHVLTVGTIFGRLIAASILLERKETSRCLKLKKKKKKLWLSQIREKVQFFLNSPSCFGWLQANYVETGNWKQCGGQFSISKREEIWIASSKGLDWVLWLVGVKKLGLRM